MEAGPESLSEIHRKPGSSDNSPSLQISFGSSASRVWNIDTTFHVGAFLFDLSDDTARSSSHSSLWPGVGPAMISVSHFILRMVLYLLAALHDNRVSVERASKELYCYFLARLARYPCSRDPRPLASRFCPSALVIENSLSASPYLVSRNAQQWGASPVKTSDGSKSVVGNLMISYYIPLNVSAL